MPCAPLSMLSGPGRTGCADVRFPVHRGWNDRDLIVSMAGICDCVKEREFYNVTVYLDVG